MNENRESNQAVLFAGQGAQQEGMGRELAEKFPDAMELWKKAERVSGLSLRGIYWEGSDKEMADTAALQPALTVVNLNIWNAAHLAPFAVAGHSLGEFSALCAAGVLSPEDTLEVVSLRGKLMAQANGGAMAAIVKLPVETVEDLVGQAAAGSGKLIVCANYNTPLQTVVSGAKEAVEMVCAAAKQKGGRGVPLAVSGAFHSPMMDEANKEFAYILKKVSWHDPRIALYCDVDGNAAANVVEIRENIAKQMVSPVRWVKLIRNLWAAGARDFLEIGPKPVLGKMVSQCLERDQKANIEHVNPMEKE